jgi:5-methylcytosine-specific restriction endonuclease McrA
MEARLKWGASLTAQSEADYAYRKMLASRKDRRASKKTKRKGRRNRSASPLPTGRPETDYHAYIVSDRWKARAKCFIRLAGRRCQQCGSKRNLTVHHLHYRTLGVESKADVEVLCWPCHESLHAIDRAACEHLRAIARDG